MRPPASSTVLLERYLPVHQFAERHGLQITVAPAQLLDQVAPVLQQADPLVNMAIALREVPRLVIHFSASRHGNGTWLSTCTRVSCPDAASLRRFRPYWLLIRPVSGLIRRRLLQRIAAAAT